MWHLVCGDNAVEGVTLVIGPQAAAERLRVLRDDLAVGPLNGCGQTALCGASRILAGCVARERAAGAGLRCWLE